MRDLRLPAGLTRWWGSLEEPFRRRVEVEVADLGIVSEDGRRYLALARGDGAMRPYHYRWLLPKLLGEDRRKWAAVSTGSVLAMVPAMRWWTGKWSPGLFGLTLHGVWDTARYSPVSVDPAAQLAAVVAAGAVRHKRWGLAVAASIVAGAIKESAPVFAAAYSTHPLPLVGLAGTAVRALVVEEGTDVDDPPHPCLVHPLEKAWEARIGRARDWRMWVAPWGGLLAGLRSDPRTVTTVALAHAQTAMAVDTARVVQWAWPVLADNVTDRPEWPIALVASWFNPWRHSV